MLIMYLAWKFIKKTKTVKLAEMDLVTDTYTIEVKVEEKTGWKASAKSIIAWLF